MPIKLVIYCIPMGAKGHIRETSDDKKNLHDDSNLGHGIYVGYTRFILRFFAIYVDRLAMGRTKTSTYFKNFYFGCNCEFEEALPPNMWLWKNIDAVKTVRTEQGPLVIIAFKFFHSVIYLPIQWQIKRISYAYIRIYGYLRHFSLP